MSNTNKRGIPRFKRIKKKKLSREEFIELAGKARQSFEEEEAYKRGKPQEDIEAWGKSVTDLDAEVLYEMITSAKKEKGIEIIKLNLIQKQNLLQKVEEMIYGTKENPKPVGITEDISGKKRDYIFVDEFLAKLKNL